MIRISVQLFKNFLLILERLNLYTYVKAAAYMHARSSVKLTKH